MQKNDMEQKLNEFIDSWRETPARVKEAFLRLKDYLAKKESVSFDFHPRPGVSYSLRAKHESQKERPLFALIDVIDDPDARWLSVCFYGGTVADPDELGNLIPQGILGEDGYCFDLEEYDGGFINYLKERIDEAYHFAAAEKP